MVPDQLSMRTNKASQEQKNSGRNEEPVLLSGSARASPLATAGYVLVVVGHLWVLRVHAVATGAEALLFASLASVEVALALEAAVYALGALGHSFGLPLLTLLGRVRLLGAAVAWPWLLPWASELSCRCSAVSVGTGSTLVHLTVVLAGLMGAFFALREVSFAVRGEPPSATGAAAAQLGDCLPGQAIFGGQFRLDKADLEETGRAVFVPARPRQGLYIGSGLAMLGHLAFGVVFMRTAALPPWLLLGALVALLGRWFGQLPPVGKNMREKGAPTDSTLLWRREGPRLACRLGELVWLWCCVQELQRCEASPTWLAVCE
ncbi:unnamed protein product [Polarella glacialis]|uniref:Uncharacterized protein n=1 Tax=Polarella glacialis TaxID=89957 RepID=A0A813FAB7_POLGL|nr:unnamed protein product [Polarella glacialis]